MELVNQPREESLGDRLLGLLRGSYGHEFDTFYVIAAYARRSGIARLAPEIERFKSSGGSVRVIVGIDQKNTTVEALEMLLDLADITHVYHNENLTNTFHPKMYAFEKKDDRAVLIIGSSNLTSSGLFTNYEASTVHELDLTDTEQARLFDDFRRMFESYSTQTDLCRRLTRGLLDTLSQGDRYLSTEQRLFQALGTARVTGRGDRVFGTETFRAPRVPPSVTRRRTETGAPSRGELVWMKRNLPRSDVQDVPAGTAPTGCLRLTQAGWKVDGELIGQTTFFREDLFGDSIWIEVREHPFVEAVEVQFRVKILGEDKGLFQLRLRHKPSGEAEQGNYTTSISWGDVGPIIRSFNLVGKTFYLYAPPEGETEPFLIEIA